MARMQRSGVMEAASGRPRRRPRGLRVAGVALASAVGLVMAAASPALATATSRTVPLVTTGRGGHGAAAATAVTARQGPLTWQPCPYPGAPATLQCASFRVPIDYAHPAAGTTTVTVDRLLAAGPGRHLGSLVFNPGGPGGSGTQFVYAESLGVPFFTAGVRAHYDIIGLDPRGVGQSQHVRCDPAVFNQHVSLFPTTQAGFDALVAHNKALGASCQRLTGPLLEHVDTLSAARDIEVLRTALGQGKLTYLGLSYGTQLGSTYASLYPQNVKRMALDGALPHSVPTTTLFSEEEAAYQTGLRRFASWCAATTTCALHGQSVLRLFDRLVAAADRHPIPAKGCASAGCRTTVTGEDIRLDAQGLLLFKTPIPYAAPDGWNDLAVALKQAAAGDATALSSPVAASPDDAAINGSGLAIECLDWPDPVHTFADLKRFEVFGHVLAPNLGGASQSWTILAGCIGWPAPVVNPTGPMHVVGTPPILITNATHDPSTSYQWAQQLASDLRSSVLLTRAGDGHTTYLTQVPSRTRDAIDRYLVTGQTPPPGTVYGS